jgi:hypothetical protein
VVSDKKRCTPDRPALRPLYPPSQITFTPDVVHAGLFQLPAFTRAAGKKYFAHVRTRLDMPIYNMAKLPTYFDSQASAAATLGIDISELRRAKAEGCPAFRSGRVYTAPLLAWFAEERQQREDLAPAKTVDGISDLGLLNDSEKEAELPKSHWDRKKARLDYERAVFRFDLEKEKYVETNEVSAAVGQMLVGFRTALNMLPATAARWLIGLRDFHQIKDKLQSEVDAVLNSLRRVEYLEKEPAEVIAKSLPFDAETEAVLENITLPGQDRGELYKLIGHIATRAITEFGRLTLSDLLQRQLPSEPLHNDIRLTGE